MALLLLKGGERMLQTPINVTPSLSGIMEDTTFHNNHAISFTFQGDILTFVQGKIVDMDDDTKYCIYTMPQNGHMGGVHNGQICSYVDANGWMYHNPLTNGHNYKHFMRLFQHYPVNTDPNLDGLPLADMYYGRGKIYETPEGVTLSTNQAVIAPNLTIFDDIPTPYEYGWTQDGVSHTLMLGAIYMDIRHERHMIYSYDKTTGVVTFKKAIYQPMVYDGNHSIRELIRYDDDNSIGVNSKYRVVGEPYRLYTNFLETGWYDFKYRAKPEIATNMRPLADIRDSDENTSIPAVKRGDYRTILNSGVVCDGTYSQSVGIGLKWYQFKLYAVDAEHYDTTKVYHEGDLCTQTNDLYKCLSATTGAWDRTKWAEADYDEVAVLTEESDKIYSYDLYTGFPTHPFDFGYATKFTVATQDDDIQTGRYAIGKYVSSGADIVSMVRVNSESIAINDDTASYTSYDSTIHLNWVGSADYIYAIFRREIMRDGSLNPKPTYLGTLAKSGTASGIEISWDFTDYSAANHQTYRYEIIVKEGRSDYLNYGRPTQAAFIWNVRTEWDGWRIASLFYVNDNKINRYEMKVGDEWKFVSAINSGDIARNINPVLHVGTSGYSVATRDNNKYESGSFTANLLQLECPNSTIIDDMQLVKEWMKFICGENPFLLRSEKGDTWVVNITNNPTRNYDETIDPILTTIAYEWAECRDYDTCVFYK